ncbi:MAG: hypothetical protein KAI66_18820 [Lentisphaeria bacterium]|nr:hypothetical protein [Lentisphaeria bacterium]
MTMRHRLLPIASFRLLALLALMVGAVAIAKPRVISSSIRSGTTPRLTANNWAYLKYRIVNPDNRKVVVRLVLKPERAATAIYSKEMTMGPRTEIAARELITAAHCDRYVLGLFVGDKRVDKSKIFVSYSDPKKRCLLFFLNDNSDFSGSGQLAKSRFLYERTSLTRSRAQDAPHHWTGYSDARAIVVADPDFREMSAMQFAAITDYVQRGGTLLFAHPAGTMGAKNTPLAEMMPVIPLRVRRVEELDELDAWGETFRKNILGDQDKLSPRTQLASPDGIEFVEAQPQGEGMTTLSRREFPVVRWRRCGLGRVGFVAIDACQKLLVDSACFTPLWNHLASWATAPFALAYFENNTLLPKMMAQLTGFQIPHVSQVTMILSVYFFLLTIILVFGYWFHHHTAAWISGAALGVLFTCGIFFSAYHRNASRPSKSVTIIDIVASGGKRTSGQAVISLFSKGDTRVTVLDTGTRNLIRSIPSVTRGKRKRAVDAPLLVSHSGATVSAPQVHVQALKPRSLASISTVPAIFPPETRSATLGANGLSLERMPLPPTLATANGQAFILLPGDILSATISQGAVTGMQPAGGGIELNTFLALLKPYLASGRFPQPSLVYLQDWDSQIHDVTLDLEGFEKRGYAIHFLPLRMDVSHGEVAIPPALLRIRPGGGLARIVTVASQWGEGILRRPTMAIPYDVQFPPWLAGVRLSEAVVEIEAVSPGENVTFDVALAEETMSAGQNTQDIGDRAWPGAVVPTSVKGSTYSFTGLGSRPLLNPVTGRMRLLVRLSQRKQLHGSLQMERANMWRIKSVRMHGKGVTNADETSL